MTPWAMDHWILVPDGIWHCPKLLFLSLKSWLLSFPLLLLLHVLSSDLLRFPWRPNWGSSGPLCHHAGSGPHHTCKTTSSPSLPLSLSLSLPYPPTLLAPFLCQFPNYLKYLGFNLTMKNLGSIFWREYGNVNSVKQKQQTLIFSFQFTIFLYPTETNICW